MKKYANFIVCSLVFSGIIFLNSYGAATPAPAETTKTSIDLKKAISI